MSKIAKIIDGKTVHVFDKSQFNWHEIRNCGQIFRDPPCEVTEDSDKIVLKAKKDKDSDWLWHYFDLETDYSEIKNELAQFDALGEAIKPGGGIRILNQPFKECVISFIISANNNIKRFSKTIAQIDFTNPEKHTEIDFNKMGCGYRAPYLVSAIKMLSTMNFKILSELDNNMLRKELIKLSGVGPKVADCIMLFAFHRLDVCPIDVHIHRALKQLGAQNADAIINHKYAGVAQQYIFYYVQHLKGQLK